MAFQPSVAEYFNNRKRHAGDDLRKAFHPSKVLVLDENSSANLSDSQKTVSKQKIQGKKIVYTNRDSNLPNSKQSKLTSNKFGVTVAAKGKKGLKHNGCQMDIRTTMFMAATKKSEEDKTSSNTDADESTIDFSDIKDEQSCKAECDTEKPNDNNVPFHIKGALSTPLKCPKPSESESVDNSELEIEPVPEKSLKTSESSTSNSRKELNLGNIRAMVSRSSRLEEMKAALKRFNENKAKLTEMQIESKYQTNENIELQIPDASPMKTPKKVSYAISPQGKLTPSRLFATPPSPLPVSPLKSPLKSPAFQRYQALVTEGRPALVLPFKYRALAELFRCVDTVCSMLHNRKETITLNKLKPAVQEISRKNLTEYHLGQIKTVFPNAFTFRMEKMRSFGSTEKYELVITPLISSDNKDNQEEYGDSTHVMMSPSVLLARRRILYNALLELTKDHHEDFLQSLDPPMCIPRARLTRWHPEFAVDDVADIISASMPQAPNTEHVTSAKDVLERARSLFLVNPRMERALKKVSENSAPTLSSPSKTSITVSSSISNKPSLHGIPASLLERVRAKQTARALEAMTRTPAQAKEAVRLTRLPEIARIVRNLFVAEKKAVLPREVVLAKLGNSYREGLTHSELDDHLKLLAEKTPGWITFCNLRKTDYVKLSRNADMSRIMARLEELAADKCV